MEEEPGGGGGGGGGGGDLDAALAHPLFIDKNDLPEGFAGSTALKIAGGLVDADEAGSCSDGSEADGGCGSVEDVAMGGGEPPRRVLRSGRDSKVLDRSTGVFRARRRGDRDGERAAQAAAADVQGGGRSRRARRRALKARRPGTDLLAAGSAVDKGNAGGGRPAPRGSRRSEASLGEVQVFLSMLGVNKKASS